MLTNANVARLPPDYLQGVPRLCLAGARYPLRPPLPEASSMSISSLRTSSSTTSSS